MGEQPDRDREIWVLHVGPDPSESGAGGMARVVGNLIGHAPPGVSTALAISMTEKRRFYSADRAVSAAMKIVRFGRNGRSIVHVHVGPGGSLAREGGLAVLASLTSNQVVVTIHASRLGVDLKNRVKRSLLTLVLARADAVQVLGPNSLRLVEPLVRRTEKILVIPNGVDLDQGQAEDQDRDPSRVFFAGEVGHRKGVDVLFDAWDDVRASHPSAELLLAGPRHPQFDAVLPQGCVELGPVAPEDIPALIASASVCVLPSRAEALPMFILESTAQGRPTVATDVGDVSLLVAPPSLIPPEDADALSHQISRVLSLSESAWRDESRATKARTASLFSMERVSEQILGLYRSVLNS